MDYPVVKLAELSVPQELRQDEAVLDLGETNHIGKRPVGVRDPKDRLADSIAFSKEPFRVQCLLPEDENSLSEVLAEVLSAIQSKKFSRFQNVVRRLSGQSP